MVQVLWTALLEYGGRIIEENYPLEETLRRLGGYLGRTAGTTLAASRRASFSFDDGRVAYDRQKTLSADPFAYEDDEPERETDGVDLSPERIRKLAEAYGVDVGTAMRLVAKRLSE